MPGIAATADPAEAAGADALLLAVPAQAVRETCALLAPHLAPSVPVAVCAKGIERETAKTMSEVVGEVLPGNPAAILSGPTYAAEVARGQPTAVTLACRDVETAEALAAALATPAFRPYHTDDVAGAEIGGAVKNVLAIACGITEGRALGENARAALITRGLVEMTRLARARGGRAETMMGLAGLGDLTLTCASRTSRNYSHGVALGAGTPPDEDAVVEGVPTSAALVRLAGRHGVEMPIAEAVEAILHRGAEIDAVIAGLLARPRRAEA